MSYSWKQSEHQTGQHGHPGGTGRTLTVIPRSRSTCSRSRYCARAPAGTAPVCCISRSVAAASIVAPPFKVGQYRAGAGQQEASCTCRISCCRPVSVVAVMSCHVCAMLTTVCTSRPLAAASMDAGSPPVYLTCQRGLSMVDVGNDAKVPDALWWEVVHLVPTSSQPTPWLPA